MAFKTAKRLAVTWVAGAAAGGVIAVVATNPKFRGKFLEMRRECMERCQERFSPPMTEEEERELAA